MDRVLQGLRLAKTALGLVPVSVPGLGPAVELALNIVELVQKAKSAKGECAALALRAAGFSLGIYEQLKHAPDVDMTGSTAEPIAALLCTLWDVENLMKRQAKKRTIMTVLWKQQELEDHIAKLNKQLDDAFKMFEVQSAIATREDLMRISTGQRFLVERAEDTTRVQDMLLNRTVHIDENMTKVLQHIAVSMITTDEDAGTMVLKRKDFRLISRIDVSVDNMLYDGDGATERYELRVEKTKETLIIKKYSGKDSEAFRSAIRRRKEFALRSRDLMPNPHIVELVAYSSPELPYGFVAIPEHIPFEEAFQKLHGTDRFLRTLDVAKQLQSAFDYLARDLKLVKEVGKRGSGCNFGTRDLYFTPEGTVRWHADVWTSDTLPGMLCMADGYLELGYEDHKAIRAINPTRLRQFLDSPNPIERAATLFLLWDKLTEFTDFNRTEDNVFWTEDVPLIGSCVHVDTWSPEGKYVYRNQKADVVQHHNSACMFAFDEDDTREEYRKIPHDGYLCELANRNRLFDGPARITKSVLTRDGCWKRHTVLDMDYGIGIRTMQEIMEEDKCRNFFLTQAVYLDLPRYIADVDMPRAGPGGHLSIVHTLHFITTSHLVSLGPSPIGKPPRRLYFYERTQTESGMQEFDAPWGYWSTSPKPISPTEFPREGRTRPAENTAFIKKYKMEVEYCGHGRDFKFVWMQSVAGFVFRIEAMVVVQSYRLTMDERLILRDVEECLTDAYARNRRVPPTVIRQNVRRKRVEIEEVESYGRSKRRRLLE
ncbi:uncharacterized protein TRAVEDRAFT_43962 [Trametes versicolor FP-101664 SS1]|uniref:uncharacterized protein n=1 Tax=Trametes versicolor (strain FP-101664) TaxID=717944 RepID=UPI0004623666|nr:uncharacterized protein TRAVEDRAFT_43962 [Trametes versicolor FP-101664 SS1]EIW61135.1 hypothetical protein TRAVEDRAFT_43962 [Trametes versicolor FP-101664 SS1]